MLGMVVRLCAGRPALLPEAISELWLAIVDYPLERRPRAIAANLAWTVRRALRTVAAAGAATPGTARARRSVRARGRPAAAG